MIHMIIFDIKTAFLHSKKNISKYLKNMTRKIMRYLIYRTQYIT